MSAASIRPSRPGLPTIPVFVRDDLSPVHQLAGMLVENHDREGLTPTEEAVAIQQLAGFEGVTQRDITTMTGIKAGVVRTALKVAASEVATAIGERHDLSLEQLLVLAEFDTDTEAVKALTVTCGEGPQPDSTTWWPSFVGSTTTEWPTRPWQPRSPRPVCPWSSWRTAGGFPRVRPGLDDLPAPERCRVLHPGQAPDLPRSRRSGQEADEGYEVAYLCLDPVGHGHVDQRQGGARHRVVDYRARMSTGHDRRAEDRAPQGDRQQQGVGSRPPRCAGSTSPSSWPGAPCPRGPCAT